MLLASTATVFIRQLDTWGFDFAKQRAGIAAGTSVAMITLVCQQGVPSPVAQLRGSGNDLSDLVPAYMTNPG